MPDGAIPRCILIFVLLIFSAIFSSTETALGYCNRIRIKTLAADGNKRAVCASKIFDQYDKAIVTLLIGNNIVNVWAASSATLLFISLLGNIGSAISAVAMTLLVFMFGETLPKNFARANCDAFVLFISYPLYGMMWILTPISWVFTKLGDILKHTLRRGKKEPSITEDEFQTIIENVEEEGVLEPEESQIIQSAVEFGDMLASDVMTPLDRIKAINLHTSHAEMIRFFTENHFSRVPVYDHTIERIVGILQTRDCLRTYAKFGKFSLEDLLIEPYLVSPDMTLHTLFEGMSHRHVHMAVVADAAGKTLGIVTMEDVLEEIVGEIHDEEDLPIRHRSAGRCKA